jgi:hypothetical protein
MWLEGLGQIEKYSGFIGNRTRDLPACNIVFQPTTLSRSPVKPSVDLVRERTIPIERPPLVTEVSANFCR